jgi:hypothetical protein
MITRQSSLRMFLVLLISLCFILACSCSTGSDNTLENTATEIQGIVQLNLNTLDFDMSEAATGLGKSGLSGTDARHILDDLYLKNDFIVDCSATDTSGKMITIMPEMYSKYEGTDISQQDVTLEFNKTRQPMLSTVFTSIEGFDAVVIIRPIVSGEDANIGSLSVLFRPEALFDEAVAEVKLNKEVAVNVMQINGLTIYDSNGKDTGTNLLTDPRFESYTELVSLGRRIADEKSGTGSYSYLSSEGSQVVKKQAYWVSAGLHGTDWRIVDITEAGGTY